MSLDKLIDLSQRIGKQIPFWTQGPGGNISVKEGNVLRVKASGVRLDGVGTAAQIADVDIPSTKAALEAIPGQSYEDEKKYSAALQGSKKPSMETGMHLVLPRKWVAHFHSLVALLMAHEYKRDPLKMTEWTRKNVLNTIEFLEALRPGLVLSQRLKKHKGTAFFVLENHGVLIQGDDPAILDAWTDVEDKFIRDWKREAVRRLSVHQPTPLKLYFPDSAVFLERLKKILEPAGKNMFQMKKDARQTDRDAYEIWWATEILYAACPELGELPVHIAGVVADLPTEKYRRGETA
jgi:ribulose-5-phosphate 4-epimerase/fuculose-1-phosphate aldolase